MNHNDAVDFARRLYARVPAHYRAYDADPEQGYALLALLRVVAEQVANVRQDLDALWDNFFIETCDDWAVPYIGALVGTNLLAQPVAQSNRLEVYNTVRWRRSKGTPAMLRALAQAISGWPTDLAEFFQVLGWSQNMNHLRLGAPLTPDLRDVYQLSLLGRAADPFAHAADFKPGSPLDAPRITPNALGIGRAAYGTPGRYQIKNLGFFVRRLQTFVLKGVTPAALPPDALSPPETSCFTFDPLQRDTPLFVDHTGEPLTRAAFDRAPWETFGKDVAVRQFGVLLASDQPPMPAATTSTTPFNFGGTGIGLTLHPTVGMRLPDVRDFGTGGSHFIITAGWLHAGALTPLGTLSTLHAALGDGDAYHPGEATPGPGQLVIIVQTGRPGTPVSPPAGLGWPDLPPAPPARFPGAVLTVRAASSGPPHAAEALYIYLPATLVRPADTLIYYVADDGSTYTAAALDATTLAQGAAGQVFPARPLTQSTEPAASFAVLSRAPGRQSNAEPVNDRPAGMIVLDPGRFAGVQVLMQAEIFTGPFPPQALGAVATVDQAAADYAYLQAPNPWPAFSYAPSHAAVQDALPTAGLLTLYLKPLAGNFIPQAEVVLANRTGASLLVYLPELHNVDPQGVRFFVAEDGSTYLVPADSVTRLEALAQASYTGLIAARASAGQVLPMPDVWPLQHRRPVALNLCRCERRRLLRPDELGIDPELGRFALAPGDAVAGGAVLSVDYVEAFSDRVGARTFDRQLETRSLPTRLVARAGDAASALNRDIRSDHIHTSLEEALAQAGDSEVIEIADSATYPLSAGLVFNRPAIKTLSLRAADGQRPCLLLHPGLGPPVSPGEWRFVSDLDRLELNGLLISGGPLVLDGLIQQLLLTACTLDPHSAGEHGSLIAHDADLNHNATYLLCRCITGGLHVGAGVRQLTVADSIIDQRGGLAISGLPLPVLSPPSEFSPPFSPPDTFSPPLSPPGPSAAPAAQSVQLERVTVLGRVRCEVLQASECLLNDLVVVDDQQAGCIRFSRYERDSVLPRRYQCVPTDDQLAACSPARRCLAPVYNSHRFGLPDYVQLASTCPPAILTSSEQGAEVGAFAGSLNTIRLNNLGIKLAEFLPVGLTSLVLAET
jgi:hypothetical protein